MMKPIVLGDPMRHAFNEGYNTCAIEAVSTLRPMVFGALIFGIGMGLALAEML